MHGSLIHRVPDALQALLCIFITYTIQGVPTFFFSISILLIFFFMQIPFRLTIYVVVLSSYSSFANFQQIFLYRNIWPLQKTPKLKGNHYISKEDSKEYLSCIKINSNRTISFLPTINYRIDVTC